MPEQPDPSAWNRARKLLKTLLPAARAAAKKAAESDIEVTSRLGDAMRPYIHERALDALFIYQNDAGAWIADVVLKGLPPGIANTFGTPSSLGHRSRKEAEAEGFALLVIALKIAAENAALEEAGQPLVAPPPAFLLFGAEIELIPGLLSQAAADPDLRLPSQAAAHDFIERALIDVLGDGQDFSKEAFTALPREDQFRILTAVHLAAVAGVHRHPPTPELSPSGHAAEPEGGHKIH